MHCLKKYVQGKQDKNLHVGFFILGAEMFLLVLSQC